MSKPGMHLNWSDRKAQRDGEATVYFRGGAQLSLSRCGPDWKLSDKWHIRFYCRSFNKKGVSEAQLTKIVGVTDIAHATRAKAIKAAESYFVPILLMGPELFEPKVVMNEYADLTTRKP